MIIKGAAVLLSLATSAAACQPSPLDSDGDGVHDTVESAVLSALAPRWYPEVVRRPQPLDWMVRHGFAKVFRRSDGGQVGRIPQADIALTPDEFLVLYDAARVLWPESEYDYQWAYFNAAQGRETNDPNDPFDWDIAAATGRGLYGRVSPSSTPGLLMVQYYMHFGWNEANAPDGCETGNHEGDWIGIDFDVDATDPARPRIVEAWFHNHGRQIFIQSPDALQLDGYRPLVYLERGVQEPWPFPSPMGFGPDTESMFPCVTTNMLFTYDVGFVCSLEFPSVCNAWRAVVREHEGVNGSFVIAPLNVGEIGSPSNNAEARFFHAYRGRYGSEWYTDDCWLFFITADTDSPQGPVLQGDQKMWSRNFDHDGLVWPSWAGAPTVHASPSSAPHGDGSESRPLRTLNGALGIVATGGEIRLGTGDYPDGPMTIRKPVTIQALGGSARIAP